VDVLHAFALLPLAARAVCGRADNNVIGLPGIRCALAAPLLISTNAHAHRGEALAPHDLWTTWNADWWMWLLIVATGALYALGVHRIWRASHSGAGIARWRAVAFALGWLALVVALLSPLDPLGGVLFSAHMVQHELLMVVAAPLLAVGRPIGAFLWALPPNWRQPAWRITMRSGLASAVAALSRPLVAWIVHAAALWLWHVPALFDASVRSELVHTAQHLSFFVTALLFWWALLKPGSERHGGAVAVLYVLTTAMHGSVLAALLTFSAHPWYTVYATTAPSWGLSALEDQQLGGLIMWVPGGTVYLGIALALMASWLRQIEPSMRSE